MISLYVYDLLRPYKYCINELKPFVLIRPHDCSRSQLAVSSLLLLSWFSFATTRSPPTIDEYRPTAF